MLRWSFKINWNFYNFPWKIVPQYPYIKLLNNHLHVTSAFFRLQLLCVRALHVKLEKSLWERCRYIKLLKIVYFLSVLVIKFDNLQKYSIHSYPFSQPFSRVLIMSLCGNSISIIELHVSLEAFCPKKRYPGRMCTVCQNPISKNW